MINLGCPIFRQMQPFFCGGRTLCFWWHAFPQPLGALWFLHIFVIMLHGYGCKEPRGIKFQSVSFLQEDRHGHTPLLWAVRHGMAGAMQLLLRPPLKGSQPVRSMATRDYRMIRLYSAEEGSPHLLGWYPELTSFIVGLPEKSDTYPIIYNHSTSGQFGTNVESQNYLNFQGG